MRTSVFGLGYVGSVTAASLAGEGHTVIGVDVNPEKVQRLGRGESPVSEAGLADLVSRRVLQGHLRATTSAALAVEATDVALVCVGTPSDVHGRLSLDAIESVAREIGAALRTRQTPFTVVVRSTVLPGTTEGRVLPALLAAAGPDAASRIRIATNPEFMREGTSLLDFARPPMTLVGCADDETAIALREIYAGVVGPFVQTAIRTAELVKYTANAYHALKASFSNEIGDLCDAFAIDPQDLMRIFMMDRKLNVSEAYLRPGFAFGGSCLPKDLRALVAAGRGADVALPVLSSLLPANAARVRDAADRVMRTGKRRVGVVGLAFKSGTDDLRESPMVSLVEQLVGRGCEVRVLDPGVHLTSLVGANQRFIEHQIPHIASLMCGDQTEFLQHADVLVLGHTGPDAASILAAADDRHVVIDLTRGQLSVPARPALTAA